MGRKPVPTYVPLDDEDDLPAAQQQQQQSYDPQANAFNEVQRYILSDNGAAPPPADQPSNYTQNYPTATPTVALRYPRSSPSRHPSLPPVPEATEENSSGGDRASTRGSVSSGSTYVEPYESESKEKGYIHVLPKTGYGYGALPTINSGEPLGWDESQFDGERDPFTDYSNHNAIVPQHTAHTAYYSADGDPAQDYAPDPSNWQSPSRPTSAFSTSSALYPTHTGYPYAQQPDLETSWTGSQSALDHFRHDAEAYASGTASRASYRPPRSRSPTPAVDDEDYHIVGNDSVHYTGYSPQRQSRSSAGYGSEEQDVTQTHSRAFQYAGDGSGGRSSFHSSVDPEKASLPAGPVHAQADDLPIDTRHFGPVPAGRMVRRRRTKKRVQLTNGNLVMQLDVPPKLIMPWKIEPEMQQTRYTAVTCDPDDFERRGYFLRQNELGRTTELFIVITMYNVRSFALLFLLFGGKRVTVADLWFLGR